jgi:ABC-type transporter Mla subunit MlaD
VNLLGEKFIDLNVGDRAHPQQRAATIAMSRTSAQPDLDQVIDALHPDTRLRLGILLRESGLALDGRGGALRRLLPGLPHTLDNMHAVLDEVSANTGALERLLATSNEVLASVNGERPALGRLVTNASGALSTLGAHPAELSATIAASPPLVVQLRRTLRRLDRTGRALQPAARGIQQTAGPLNQVLTDLPSFESAAKPALRTIRQISPALESLAVGARPAVRQLPGVMTALETALRAADPVTKATETGAPDILGTLQGWASANQVGDAAGTVFSGTTSITPALRAVLGAFVLGKPPSSPSKAKPDRAGSVRTPSARPPTQGATSPKAPKLPPVQVPPVVDKVTSTVKDNTAAMKRLLDFLLGH